MLNSTAGVLLEDIFRGCFKVQPSERVSSMIVKGSILVLGALSMVFLLIVEKLGGVLEVRKCIYSTVVTGFTHMLYIYDTGHNIIIINRCRNNFRCIHAWNALSVNK